MNTADNNRKVIFFMSLLLISACSKEESKVPTVSSLSCSSAKLSSPATSNVLFSGKVTIPYEGGNGLNYTVGSPIQSTGVIGLTAIIRDSTLLKLNNGSGTLIFNITGTPNTSGTAKFALSFGDKKCDLDVSVFTLVGSWKRTTSVRSGAECRDIDSENCSSNCDFTITASMAGGLPYTASGNMMMLTTSSGVVTATYILSANTLILFIKANSTQGTTCDSQLTYVRV